MKRKTLYVLLLSCCILGLSACGKSDAEQAAEYYQGELGIDEDDAKEIADAFYGNEGDKNQSEETQEVIEVVATDEILSADMYCNKVQILNTVYEFPLKVGDLLASGELKLENPEKYGELNENTLVAPGEFQMFKLSGVGVEMYMHSENQTDSMTELKNCIVNPTSILSSESVIYSGGLREGMSLDELTDLFGEPDHFDTENYRYYYYEDMYLSHATLPFSLDSLTGYWYSIGIDRNNGCIGGIVYNMGNAGLKNEEFIEYVISGNGYDVFCYLPEDFSIGKRLIEVDGSKYVFTMKKETYTTAYEQPLTVDYLTSLFYDEVRYCVVNDNGTAIVISAKDDGRYGYLYGHYYMDNYCVRITMRIEQAFDEETSISDAAKQKACDLMLEVFNKGITVK